MTHTVHWKALTVVMHRYVMSCYVMLMFFSTRWRPTGCGPNFETNLRHPYPLTYFMDLPDLAFFGETNYPTVIYLYNIDPSLSVSINFVRNSETLQSYGIPISPFWNMPESRWILGRLSFFDSNILEWSFWWLFGLFPYENEGLHDSIFLAQSRCLARMTHELRVVVWGWTSIRDDQDNSETGIPQCYLHTLLKQFVMNGKDDGRKESNTWGLVSLDVPWNTTTHKPHNVLRRNNSHALFCVFWLDSFYTTKQPSFILVEKRRNQVSKTFSRNAEP